MPIHHLEAMGRATPYTSSTTTNNLILRLRWIILQFPERTVNKASIDKRSQHFFGSPPSVLRIENLVTIKILILAHHLILDIIDHPLLDLG